MEKCICKLCTCGKHKCPKKHFATNKEFNANSEYKTNFTAKDCQTPPKLIKPTSCTKQSSESIESTTTYRKSFKEYDCKREPSYKPEEVHIQPDLLDDTTTYNQSYQGKYVEQMKPIKRKNDKKQVIAFSGTATYKDHFQKHDIDLNYRKFVKPNKTDDDLKLCGPLEKFSEYKRAYQPIDCAEPIQIQQAPGTLSEENKDKPFNASTVYQSTFTPMNCEQTQIQKPHNELHLDQSLAFESDTTHRHDFTAHSNCDPTISAKPKETKVCRYPFSDTTTYVSDYLPHSSCQKRVSCQSQSNPLQIDEFTSKRFAAQSLYKLEFQPKTQSQIQIAKQNDHLGVKGGELHNKTVYKEMYPSHKICQPLERHRPNVDYHHTRENNCAAIGDSIYRETFVAHKDCDLVAKKVIPKKHVISNTMDKIEDTSVYRSAFGPLKFCPCPAAILNSECSDQKLAYEDNEGHVYYTKKDAKVEA
ncbi:hypothetical protein GJ496_000005 [Pomphorhynchus laevis]|nr:hypothetical protein GJ496_000005 [Pomphorhynchus laevis]